TGFEVVLMYIVQPKKLLIMNILDILKRYSDEDHRLSQKDIVEILKNEYNMPAERKAVKRNLMNLIDFGYEINYSESVRMVPGKDGKPEENYILSDFYLERDFTDSELRLLIDSLLFSKHIPYSQCKELVNKLSGLSNQYFKSRIKYISTLPDNAPHNKQLLLPFYG
ncbi:MAG: WYL domain-containing protein, partial [Eubacterium sp.]|nr:WYL domain-containing protein [Eubacterium sp.]